MEKITSLLQPNIAYAATSTAITQFVYKIDQYILNPLIILLFGVGLAYFLFGVLKFMIDRSSGGEGEGGREHMLWGVVGMFLMIAVFGLIKIIEHTLGIGPNPLIG